MQIPLRSLAIGVAVGVLFALVGWFVSVRGTPWLMPALVYLAGLSVALAMIDVAVHRLPDSLVLPAYPVSVVLLALASWAPGGTSDWTALIRAVAAGLVVEFFYVAVLLVNPPGMGWGDVKLAGVLGMYLGWFGWGGVVVGAVTPFLLGGVFAAVLLAIGRVRRSSSIAFGPWMLTGAAVGIAVGPSLWARCLAAATAGAG